MKVSPNLFSAWSHPARAIKQSEMAAICAGLGETQMKHGCESRLAAAHAGTGATYQEVWGLGSRGWGLTEAGCCLFERI